MRGRRGRGAEVVLGAADLIEGDGLPQCLPDLRADVAAYEALVLAWERGDFSEYWNPIDFPARNSQNMQLATSWP